MNVIFLASFAGVSLAFALLSLSVYALNKDQRLYLLFGVFSLFSGAYFLFLAVSASTDRDLSWAILFSAASYYAIFPWFLFEFVGKRGNAFLWPVSLTFFLAYSAYLLGFSVGIFPLWQIIAHVGLVGLIILVIMSYRESVKVNMRSRYKFMTLCSIFILLSLEEIVRTYSGLSLLTQFIGFMQPLDVFPLLFTFSMGIRISSDFIHSKEMEVQSISAELNLKRLELAQLESKSLRDEIEFKKKDLMFFGIELNLKNKFFSSIVERMSLLKMKESIRPSDLDEIIKYTKSQLRIGQNLDYYHANIDKVNHEFLSKLKKRYPSLTENELHLSSLLRLKLNSKEIANIKNISPDSVKVLRYRLRKKFNLSKEINLVEFLQDF